MKDMLNLDYIAWDCLEPGRKYKIITKIGVIIHNLEFVEKRRRDSMLFIKKGQPFEISCNSVIAVANKIN